jgi:WD40 repeat protein
MSSTWNLGKRTFIVFFLVVFGLGIIAERYRQFLISNVGDLTIKRMDKNISLSLNGDDFINWHSPVTLRAGSHKLQAKWGNLRLDTQVNVKRGDQASLNRIQYSLRDGQLEVAFNSRLIDVVPRSGKQVFAIQSSSGMYWQTGDGGEIMIRPLQEVGTPEMFTIHWLRPDHSEAFIQSGDGRYLTDLPGVSNLSPSLLETCKKGDWPTTFDVSGVKNGEPWIRFATGQHFVDADADSNRLQLSRYAAFASPHLLRPDEDFAANKPRPKTVLAVQTVAKNRSVRRLSGHKNVIRAVVITPDGKHIISGSSDATIRFWNLKSGKQVNIIRAHRPVMSLAISSDGKSLACGMTDAVVKMWRLKDDAALTHYEEQILSRDYRGDVLAIAFSPDGTKIVAGGNSNQHTRVWDLNALDQRCKSSTINGPVTSLAWSRDNQRVLLCELHGQSLRWFPINSKSTAINLRDAGRGDLVIRSGDVPLIVSGSDVLDAETLQKIHSFDLRDGTRAVSAQVSVSGNLFVTGDIVINAVREIEPDEMVSTWDLKTGRPLAVLRDRFGQVGNVAISPNGEHVVYGNGIRSVGYHQEKLTGDYDLRVWRIFNDQQ